MEIGNEKVREYLIALKETGRFSYEDVANLSGTPVQTVRNYYSGKTPNPSFATVAKMIISKRYFDFTGHWQNFSAIVCVIGGSHSGVVFYSGLYPAIEFVPIIRSVFYYNRVYVTNYS